MRPKIVYLGLSRLHLQTLRCHFPIIYEFCRISKDSLDVEKNIKQLVSTDGCVFINPQKISAQQLNNILVLHEYATKNSHATVLCFTKDFTDEQKKAVDTKKCCTVSLSKGRDKKLSQVVRMMNKAHTPCCDDFATYAGNMFNDGWYIVDFETTGLDPLTDEIILFSISYMANYEIEFAKTFYIKQQQKIPKEVEELTGITNEMLENGITKEELIAYLKALPAPAPWLLYSSSYYVPFLKALFISCREHFEIPFMIIDEISAVVFCHILWKSPYDVIPYLEPQYCNHPEVPQPYLNKLYILTLALFDNLQNRYGIRSLGDLDKLYNKSE